MDCDKFDQHVIDALYDELDEVTHAALRRHVEGCSRCATALAGLRAARQVAVLPLAEPSADLEDRIFEATATAQRTTPWPKKAMRMMAWAGSHAMRPQLAMAALFVLVIGSSLLLLRARPGTMGAGPVRVTEHGVPGIDAPEAAAAPIAAAEPSYDSPQRGIAPSPAAAEAAPPRDATEKDKDKKADAMSDSDAALAAARAVRSSTGCAAAVGRYDEVGARFPGTPAAATAMWEAASCYKSMGEADKARELLVTLKESEGYRERAEGELALEERVAGQGNQMPGGAAGGRPAAAAPARAASKAAPKPAAPPDSAKGEAAQPKAPPPPPPDAVQQQAVDPAL